MKTVKLKPIFFPNDDILVKPPTFIELVEDPQVAGGKNKTFSNTDQLKNLLKGRRSQKKTIRIDDEEETVKKLEDWKGNDSPKSPLRKKFTFRRGITSREESSEAVRGKNSLFTLAPVMDIEHVANVFQSIVAVERMKKKSFEAEAKRITEANLMMEQGIKAKIHRVSTQLEGIKEFLKENQQKLEELKEELKSVELKHEEKMHEIALSEAQELLFSEKGKKKLIRPGEESQYFIKKEKFRHVKQDLHKKYQDDKEFLTSIISKTQISIKATENLRQEGKKNLKGFREELIQLYCRALKDAKDIRTDGLRWIIKSLWKMHECVPVSAFPKFFDEDSCHFLVVISEKDLELDGLTSKLEALRREIKQKKNSYSIKTTRELYKNIRNRLRVLSQSSIGEDINKSPVNGLNDDLNQTDSISNANYLQISILREKIVETQNFIKDFSNQEIKRITDNYQANPGEAESVGLFHLIRCLVGDRVREFNRYTRASKANIRVHSANK